jgi:UDP-glucose 4-epimerase
MLTEQAYGRVFNIGSTSEIAIGDLAHTVRAATDSASEITLVPYDEAYEEGFEDMARRVPDISRIGDLLGWAPTRTLEQILNDVIEYERQGDQST